jgi:hypothetical protein
MNNINTLTTGTINGLTDLSLDTLTTTNLNSETIDGNIIYYNRIEGNEIIVDTKLTLTNTGVISVGDKFISDIELTYLDGVNDYIQKQIDNIAGQELQFQAQIDNHTNQINDLQISDAEQNTLLENLEASVNTYDFRIETLEINDATQTGQITALQTSDTSQNTAITTLQAKTQYISSTSFATTMSRPLYITGTDILRLYGNHSYFSGWSNVTNNRDWVIGTPNNGIKQFWIANEKQDGIYLRTGSRVGNTNLGQNKIITNSNGISLRRGGITAGDAEITVGEIGALTDGNLRINGTSTNNIILSSGLGEINCESNLLRIGSTTANSNGRKSNILMYDSTGTSYETQSSAFTETLKSQIGANTSQITALQNSNSSLNSSITALQTSDTAQNTAITALQTVNTTQTSQITALQSSDTAQNTNITTLQSKTQNISFGNSSVTNMIKPLIIRTDGECLKTFGNHTYWGGYDTDGITKHFKIGKESSTTNSLMVQNYTLGEIVIRTGSSATNSNLGRNRIVTTSSGISIQRGGVTQGDQYIVAGIIGAVDPLNSHLYINGNGTNSIIVDSGIGSVVLWTNTVKIGNAIPVNGKYANLQFKLNAGDNWETQSSAFTEDLKAKLLSLRNFNNGTGKIEFIAESFWWLGFAYNLTTLIASRLYDFAGEGFYYGAEMSVGSWLNPFGYASMFDATGAYLLNDKPNLTLIFEMDFTAAFSSVNYIISKVVVKNNAGTVLTETLDQGTYYNGAPQANARHYKYLYSTAPLRHILNQGDRIFVNTRYIFTTPNSMTIDGVKMKGKFSMHAN